MHLLAPEVGMMVASAVVASTISHAVGAAFAAKYRRQDQVTVATFGDGATEEGAYHESLNFAALHKVPVIFLCENNNLAVHSPLKAREAYTISEHARAYNLPVTRLAEGYDFLKVHEAFARVVKDVRRHQRPQFVEILTYRYREHVGPGEDYDAGYRSRAELERWQVRDPLLHNQKLIEAYRPAITREIDDAVAFAETSPWPDHEELLAHVI